MDKIVNIHDFVKSWKSPEPVRRLDDIDDEDFQVVRSIMFPDGLDVESWFDDADCQLVKIASEEIANNKRWFMLDEVPPAIQWYWFRNTEYEALVVIDHDGMRMILNNGKMIVPIDEEYLLGGEVCGPLNMFV